MTHLITLLLITLISFLSWMVVSKRVPLPVLFEAGLSAIAFGLVLVVCAIFENTSSSPAGAAFILIGMFALFLSTRRQRMKRRRELNKGEPRVIDGADLRHPSGGRE